MGLSVVVLLTFPIFINSQRRSVTQFLPSSGTTRTQWPGTKRLNRLFREGGTLFVELCSVCICSATLDEAPCPGQPPFEAHLRAA